jgi:hypothetical protein
MSTVTWLRADSFHRGKVDVHAKVSQIESLRREPTQEYYYRRRTHQELSDRVWLADRICCLPWCLAPAMRQHPHTCTSHEHLCQH